VASHIRDENADAFSDEKSIGISRVPALERADKSDATQATYATIVVKTESP